MSPGLRCRLWSLAGVVGLLAGCAPRGIVKPHAPDMTALVESYDSPTGVLTAKDTVVLTTTVGTITQLLDQTDLTGRLRELLKQLIEPVAPLTNDEDQQDNAAGLHLDVKADGYLEATRICPGWTLPAVVDPDNGTIHATATFTEAGPDPVVWGSVTACRYRIAGTRIEISGASDSLRVYWGEGVDSDNIDTRDLVFSVNVRVDIDGDNLPLDVDFRVVDGGALEYLLHVDSGTLVVRANADGSFALRARDGGFRCDESFDCERER